MGTTGPLPVTFKSLGSVLSGTKPPRTSETHVCRATARGVAKGSERASGPGAGCWGPAGGRVEAMGAAWARRGHWRRREAAGADGTGPRAGPGEEDAAE